LRDKLASSSFVVAVPSGGLFLDVSQSVCGGPSSSLSLAVSIAMRISYFELTLCLKLESAVTQSRTVPSSHDLFSAAFTTIIAESNFQYTQVSAQ
jgi:hypothetical protein